MSSVAATKTKTYDLAYIAIFAVVMAVCSWISMVIGLLVCYALGTIWFMVVYARTTGAVGLGTVLSWCVIPFIVPDLVKIALAFVLSRKVRKYVPMQ